MRPYVLGAIFARGGSKGIPGKNIKNLAGKPLISYAIEIGRQIPSIDRVIVSTDDDEIAGVARKHGAEVPFMRPKHLASDSSPEILSWKHAIRAIEEQTGRKVDILVSIPATSPLRAVEDVNRCLEKLFQSDADIVVTVKEAERNPYFNMVIVDENDDAELVIQREKDIDQRQQAPEVYDMTTVAYAVRAPYVLNASSILEGKVKAVKVPRERALDIDTMLDFEIAEFLMEKRRINE